MPDLLWDDVKNFFDPQVMGALPDVCVTDTTAEDWQALYDLVRTSGWTWAYREDAVERPLPPAREVLSRPAGAETAELRVRPAPGVLAIFRMLSAGEIDFDVDLRELQGQQGVDTLCAFLGTIGRRLGKAVVMTAEGDHGNPVLGFDPVADRVMPLADPRLV
ncbi:hypothetical protein ABZ557_29120 [Streptomyces sp. NPDC019645]|uniref:hypothetical protein n=1 Tax=Streptomyces sp. NPDC019645 TaxID=3154786 RepID=UPI00340C2475